MNPADWPEIERLYLAATQLTPDQRASLLQSTTPAIRDEVESLLAADDACGDFLNAPPAALASDLLDRNPGQLTPGHLVASYRIQRLISVGGMGEVYLAEHTSTNQLIALKLLRRHLTIDPIAADRFQREALAASTLNHPNIVAVHEFGDSDAGLFIAMEWVDGITFRVLFQTNPDYHQATLWSRQAAHALAAAHASGIIHRDIKPDNLMLSNNGTVKILDFGLAKLSTHQLQDPVAYGADGTISGTLSGTLPYMSPEVLLGETATSASDIFALASVLYELFTGHHPFAGETPLDVFEAIECHTPTTPSNFRPHLPPSLDQLLLSMLNRQPDLRPTAAEIAVHLDQIEPTAA